MDKRIELVELDSGEVVAVGPFHDQGKAVAFAEIVEGEEMLPLTGSRGGVRLLTVDALARELGVSPRRFKPSDDRPATG